VAGKWNSLQEVFDEHPDVFPQGNSLREVFDWSYRVITTRGMYTEELSLIPMADFMNYANHELYFESKDQEIILLRVQHPDGEIDYRDFSGSPVKSQVPIENTRFQTRLDKFLARGTGKEALKGLNAIWEVEKLMGELESSDDEEELEIIEGKAEEEDEEEEEKKEEIGGDYIVVSTDSLSGFNQGAPILYQIRRLSDRDWLLQYGCCFEHNWFNSVYIMFWAPSYGRTGPIGLEDMQRKTYQTELSAAKLADVCELVALKEKRLNLEIFKYYRKTINYAELNLKEPGFKASPSSVDVELAIIEIIAALYGSIEEKMSPLAHDLNLLNRNLPKRMKYALLYRIGQKRILASQKKMLGVLKSILIKHKEGGDISKHLEEKTIKGVKQAYPLNQYLKSFWVNIKNLNQAKAN
jgi:hypothetical protein